MPNPVGRPLKYLNFLEILDDETVYCPYTIFQAGRDHGLVAHLAGKDEIDPKEERLYKIRIRHTLARFVANHHFPEEGDGLVKIKGQTPPRGWKGSRWKKAARLEERNEPHGSNTQ